MAPFLTLIASSQLINTNNQYQTSHSIFSSPESEHKIPTKYSVYGDLCSPNCKKFINMVLRISVATMFTSQQLHCQFEAFVPDIQHLFFILIYFLRIP